MTSKQTPAENQPEPKENPTGVPPEGNGTVPQQTDQPGTGGGQHPAENQTPKAEENTADERIRYFQSKFDKADSDNKKLQEENERLKNLNNTPADDKKPFYLDPSWVPETKEDLAAMARALREDSDRQIESSVAKAVGSREQSQQAAEKTLDDFIAIVKEGDKDFDENAYFQYLTDIKFQPQTATDLRNGYYAYLKYQELAQKVARQPAPKPQPPINNPGSSPGTSGTVNYGTISGARNAQELVADALRGRK